MVHRVPLNVDDGAGLLLEEGRGADQGGEMMNHELVDEASVGEGSAGAQDSSRFQVYMVGASMHLI